MSTHPPTAIRTASGRLVDLADFKPEDVLLSDIATSLARQERWTGHCPLRPTVAQHSLAVEHIALELLLRSQNIGTSLRADESAALARAALMHDAQEAYVSDLSAPAKRTLRMDGSSTSRVRESAFDIMEKHVADAVVRRFACYPVGYVALIHEADQLCWAYEAAYANWNPGAALPAWLERDPYVRRCYDMSDGDEYSDGGEAAFLLRAAALGMRDA